MSAGSTRQCANVKAAGEQVIDNIFTDKPGSARHRDSLIHAGIPAHEDWQHKPSDNVFRFRTGRLAGGRSGNTVGRQQLDSRGHAKFALDPCRQRVDKLPATFFVADPTLDLQNDFSGR